MDQGPPDTKRPRLSTGSPWSAGSHHGVSLLHPTPSPTATQLPHHPTPSPQYQQPSPHPFSSRPPGPGDPGHPPPPPPPPPPQSTPIDDRRHHEPERYPPMQDHRQQPLPPHSPAHAQFPNYPHREPMVKADPGDDTLSHLRRPHSTGAGPDNMTPGTPHSAVPPQSYVDEKRHMSFDSGPPQPPIYHRQTSYPPPPTPVQHHQPYPDYPPSYGGGQGYLENGMQIQIAHASGKRKAQRASQACDMCRQLKAKCDENKPCKSCKEKKIECKYREAVPKQQDKMAADLLDAVLAVRNQVELMNRRLVKIERRMDRAVPAIEHSADMMDEDDDRPVSPHSAGAAPDDAYSSSPGDTVTATQAPITAIEARNITRNIDEEPDVEPGTHIQPKDSAIPSNHTTLAGLLLGWKSVQKLLHRQLEIEALKYPQEFPTRQEERRGILRVWGRGEGSDNSWADRESGHDLGMMEVHDDYSDTGAPSPADCWGGISGSPGPIDGKSTVIAVQTLDFTESTVWKYVASFNENIQNMHPLIVPRELHAMVKVFLDNLQLSMKQSRSGSSIAKFVPPIASETGIKRKRSPAPEMADSPSLPPKQGKPTFQRSIQNALVLLVLALGKICLWKEKKLPDVVPSSDTNHGSPVVRNGIPTSPVQGSPPAFGSGGHSSGLPSPKENTERSSTSSRRPSFQGGGPMSARAGTSLRRNLDVIPGLDYFAYATDILGGQLGGLSLRHIHAWILAGLYHGQLGRVVESYSYIKEAGLLLQQKMRPHFERFKMMKENYPSQLRQLQAKSDTQLLFAFWTCLQLESDIVAELPLPQSNILAYEDDVPYPNLDVAKSFGYDDKVLASYLAQLYLRKNLNAIHATIYNPSEKKKRASDLPTANDMSYVQTALTKTTWAPEMFKFENNDPPAQDLIHARLRAKYWGAKVISTRPFIKHIVETNHDRAARATMATATESPATVTAGGEATSLTPGSVDTPGAAPGDSGFPREYVDWAREGIQALIESTRAFHNVPDRRFIITNPFGTAHAQWGNLLTLSAAYRDPTLHEYVDERLLRELFNKTIAFLRIHAQPSSALTTDIRILEELQNELWGASSSMRRMNSVNDIINAGHPGSSFSSTASAGPPPLGGPHHLPPMAPSLPGPSGPGHNIHGMYSHGPGTPVEGMTQQQFSLPPMQNQQHQQHQSPAQHPNHTPSQDHGGGYPHPNSMPHSMG